MLAINLCRIESFYQKEDIRNGCFYERQLLNGNMDNRKKSVNPLKIKETDNREKSPLIHSDKNADNRAYIYRCSSIRCRMSFVG